MAQAQAGVAVCFEVFRGPLLHSACAFHIDGLRTECSAVFFMRLEHAMQRVIRLVIGYHYG
jgi:hypothetical protein